MHYFTFLLAFCPTVFVWAAHTLPVRINDDLNKIENAGYAAYFQPAYTILRLPNEAAAAIGSSRSNFRHYTGRGIFDTDVLQMASLVLKLPSPTTSSSSSSSSATSVTTKRTSANLRNTSDKEYFSNNKIMQPQKFS